MAINMNAFECNTFEEIDAHLKRDLFMDESAIHTLLWTADQATYDKIVANRKEYSQRIRWILCPQDFLPDPAKLKYKILEVEIKDLPSQSLTPEQQSGVAQSTSSPNPSRS